MSKAAVISLTGAGISKSAGIPTFMETPGLSAKLSVDFKREHPEEFRETIELLKRNCSNKQPTPAHCALAAKQIPIITMNVDGLHQAADSEFVLELHGSFARDNVVLYGQSVLNVDEAIGLIASLGAFSRANSIDGYFLIVGSSMQTQFANYLALLADRAGLSVVSINENADEAVPKFLDALDLSPQTLFLKRIA